MHSFIVEFLKQISITVYSNRSFSDTDTLTALKSVLSVDVYDLTQDLIWLNRINDSTEVL